MRIFIAVLLLLPNPAPAKDLRADPYLFHAGERKLLEEDIAANTVPQPAWDDFIFGKTNFDLPDYRKGLYGAEAMAGTSLYSLYDTLGGIEPWVMVIQVKKSCLVGNALYSAGYEVAKNSAKLSLFGTWYNANRDKYKSLEKDCLSDFSDAGVWQEGAFYDLGKSDAETQRLTKLCTPVIDDFLKENSIKLVLDAANDDSWYIRDRSCIEGIRGTADDLFTRILADDVGGDHDSFVGNFYGDPDEAGVYYSGNTYLFLAVAADTTLLTSASLPKLAKLESDLGDWIGTDPQDEAKLLISSNYDNPYLLRLGVQALQRSIRAGKTQPLQAALKSWLTQARARLATDCDGKHGVRPEKGASCKQAEQALTKSLVSLFHGA